MEQNWSVEIHVYMTDSFHCAAETSIVEQLYFN